MKYHTEVYFKLNKAKLKKYYDNYRDGYNDLLREFEKYDFSGIKGRPLVFKLDRVMPKEELDAVIVKVCEVLPWLGDCIEEAEAMELGEPKSFLSKLKNPDE